MSNREVNTNQVNTIDMSDRMVAALVEAADRPDHAIMADRRTWGALHSRGLVDVLRGKGSNRRGETVYNVVTGVYINDAGREAVTA